VLDPRRLALARRGKPLPDDFARSRFWASRVFAHRDFRIMGTMSDDNNSGMHACVDPRIFSAIITPHRSLGPKGFLIFMLCLGFLSFTAGFIFVSLGAWPVFVFFGLAVLLVYPPSPPNSRPARAYEEAPVPASKLPVQKVNHRGGVRQ